MKTSKSTLNFILNVTPIIVIILSFIWNYYENNLSFKEFPYILLFYIGVIAFYISIAITIRNIALNSDNVIYEKYKIYKALNQLDKNNQLNNFEIYCIEKNNKKILEKICSQLSFEDSNSFMNLIKNKKIIDAKNFLQDIKNHQKKQVLNLFENYDKPEYYNIFINYYNKNLIKKKNSLFSSFLSLISFVLSIIPLLSNNFSLIPLDIYLEFIFPLAYILYQSCSIYKETKNSARDEYNAALINIINDINTYNVKK